ncbi:hypothetical protein JCM6882_001022 [Rhodosporidiobolus microsporus]
MTDTGRESISSKVERTVEPEGQKTTTEQIKDTAKEAYDKAASAVQPESEKSTTQKVTDTLSGGEGTQSGGKSGDPLVDKAKDTLGVGGDKTSATETNV